MKKKLIMLLVFMFICCVGILFSACKNEPKKPTGESIKAVSIIGAKDYVITESVTDFSFIKAATGVLSDETTKQVLADTSKVVLGKSGKYEITYTFTEGGKTITETKTVTIYGLPELTAKETTIYYSQAAEYDVRSMATATDSFGNSLQIKVLSDGGFAINRYVYASYTVKFSVADPAGQELEAEAKLHVVREEDKEPFVSGYDFDTSENELILYADLKGQELFCVETEGGYVFPDDKVFYDSDKHELRMPADAFDGMSDTEYSLIVRSTHGYTNSIVDFSDSPITIEMEGLRFTREKGKISLPVANINVFGEYETQKTLISADGNKTDVTEVVPQDLNEGVYDLQIEVENVYGAKASRIVQINIVSSDAFAALIDDAGSREKESLYRAENYVGSVNGYTDEEVDGVAGVYKVVPTADSTENASQIIWEPFATDLEKFSWLAFDVCVSDATDATTIQFLCEFHALILRDGAKMPFTPGKWTTLSIDLQYLKELNNAGVITDTYGFSLLTKNHKNPYYVKNVRWVAAEAGLRSSFEGSWEVCNELYVPLGNEGVGVTAEINQDKGYVTHGEKSIKLTGLGQEGGYNFVVNHAGWFSTDGYTHFAVDVQLVVPEGTQNAVIVIYTGVSPWFYNSGTALEIRPGAWYTIELPIPANSTYIQLTDAAQPVGGGGLGEGWSLYLDNLRCVSHV